VFVLNALDYPNRAFFGIISTDPITSLQITSEGLLNLDNFAFGTAAIPEPASLLLFGVGLAGLKARRWVAARRA
jgi:hypothetical protein